MFAVRRRDIDGHMLHMFRAWNASVGAPLSRVFPWAVRHLVSATCKAQCHYHDNENVLLVEAGLATILLIAVCDVLVNQKLNPKSKRQEIPLMIGLVGFSISLAFREISSHGSSMMSDLTVCMLES